MTPVSAYLLFIICKLSPLSRSTRWINVSPVKGKPTSTNIFTQHSCTAVTKERGFRAIGDVCANAIVFRTATLIYFLDYSINSCRPCHRIALELTN